MNFNTQNILRLARKPVLIGGAIFILLSIVNNTLSYVLFRSVQQQERSEALSVAAASRDQLQTSLLYALSASRALELLAERTDVQHDFDSVAIKIMETFKSIDAVELAPDGIVQQVYPYEQNKKVLGFNILTNPVQQKEALAAIEKHEAVFAGPVTLVQGGVGVVGRQPIFKQNNEGQKVFWGFSLVIIRIESALRVAQIDELESKGYAFQLSRMDSLTHTENIFAGTISGVTDPISVPIHLPNNEWILSIYPHKGWNAWMKTFPFFFIGFLFSALCGIFTWFIARQPEKLQQLVDKKTLEVLANEERYRSISDVTSDYLFSSFLDEHGGLQHRWLDGAFEEITGYTREEYIAQGGWRSTLHPDDVHRDNESFQQLLSNHKTITELRTIAKKGNIVWVRVYAHPIWDNNKHKLIGIHGAVQNITERKQAEESLRESEERYRTLFETSQDGISLIGLDGAILFVNKKKAEIFGYTNPSDLVGKNGFALLHPDEVQKGKAMIDLLMSGKQVSNYEIRSVRSDGSSFIAEYNVSLIKDSAGTPLYFMDVVRDVTERKYIEEQLLQSEKRFRTLVEGMNEALIQVDLDDTILYVNNRFCSLSGYTRDEVTGQIGHTFLFNEHDGALIKEKNELRKQKIWDSYTVRLKRKDGSHIWVYISGAPLSDADGNIVGSFGVFTDITEQKISELAVQKNMLRLNAVNKIMETVTHGDELEKIFDEALAALEAALDTNRSAILLADQNGTMHFTSWHNLSEPYRTAADGHSPWKAGDPSIHTIIVSDVEQDQTLHALLKSIIDEGIRSLIFVPLLYKGTLIGKFMIYYAQVSHPDSHDIEFAETIAGHVAVAISKKNAEETLRDNEQRYRLLADNMTDVVWTLDLQTQRFTYVSPSVFLLRGYTPDEVMTQSMQESLTPDSFQKVTENLSLALKLHSEGKPLPGGRYLELEQPCKDGTTVWTEVSTVLLSGDNGRIGKVIGVSRNIMERKRTEQAMLQTQKIESLGVLAGGVAHDFNNILQAILGHATIALKKVGEEHSASTNIHKLESAAQRAADLTRQLLAYSGRGKFIITNINCNDILSENIHLFEVSVPKNVRLEFFPAPDLPSIAADPGQIQQIVMNLIINAGEAIGIVPGTISISTFHKILTEKDVIAWSHAGKHPDPGHVVMVEVKDNGSGMSQETLTKIFDPFFTTKFTGRGLGLAAVLGIIVGHKGGIQVESSLGKGTTFRIAFPVSSYQQKILRREEPSTAHPIGDVLIIDDEKMLIEITEEYLQEKNIRLFSSTTGEDGIALYKKEQHNIAVVLLDLSMPGMSGQETYKHLREINPNVKVILTSGYSEDHALELFGISGLSGFIQKPYHPDILYQELLKHLVA